MRARRVYIKLPSLDVGSSVMVGFLSSSDPNLPVFAFLLLFSVAAVGGATFDGSLQSSPALLLIRLRRPAVTGFSRCFALFLFCVHVSFGGSLARSTGALYLLRNSNYDDFPRVSKK